MTCKGCLAVFGLWRSPFFLPLPPAQAFLLAAMKLGQRLLLSHCSKFQSTHGATGVSLGEPADLAEQRR